MSGTGLVLPGAPSEEADRRTQILAVALELFAQQGYAGTSLRQIADAMGFTVAAIYYHFKAKDEILAVLAEPYLRDLDALVFEAENAAPISAQRARKVLISYLDMLLRNTTVTHFLEQDLAVQAQPLGKRLDKLTERLRISLAGSQPDASDLIRASASLGALRRPVLRLSHLDLSAHRQQLVDQAMSVLRPGARRRKANSPS